MESNKINSITNPEPHSGDRGIAASFEQFSINTGHPKQSWRNKFSSEAAVGLIEYFFAQILPNHISLDELFVQDIPDNPDFFYMYLPVGDSLHLSKAHKNGNFMEFGYLNNTNIVNEILKRLRSDQPFVLPDFSDFA